MKKPLRRFVSLALSALMAALAFGGALPAAAQGNVRENIQQQFYVSPEGDDQNDGSEGSPFATIERARQAVDEVNDHMTGDIIVNIAPGDYYITETIQMGPGDSGTGGFEVVYRASGAPGSARLIGGQKVTGEWKLADESDQAVDLSADMIGKVYKIEMGDDAPVFNTLYVNGGRATMARTPNREDNDRFSAGKDAYLYASGGQEYGIAFPSGQLPQEQVEAIQAAISRGEEGCQVYGWDWNYRNWFTSTIPVTGISGNMLTFSPDPDNRVANRPKYPFESGARFFLQGNLAFLDVPGEYHYNKRTHTLYYYPEAGEENLNEQEIIIPCVQEIFRLEGNEKKVYASAPESEDMVRNIAFEGLEVGYTEFTDSYSSGWNSYDGYGAVSVFPEEALVEGITQPSYCEQTERVEFRKGAFTLLQTSHITLDSMRIVNTGLTGVTAWGDNDHITLQNSELAHLGLHGINIDGGYPGPDTGKYSYNHLITNNVIHDMGELVGHGTGIQALQVHDSEFSHMELYNSPRRAIFQTGAWANRVAEDNDFVRYRDAHTYNNHWEYLYLHDLQQDGGDDGAFFNCTLYGSWGDTSGYKENYINQVYMDNVGAPPSNKDFKPNGMNLDMGCAGMQVSNMKVANPQHYAAIWGTGDPGVKFDNVNFSYYPDYSDANSRSFDESRMEYDKIGANADSFPYPDAITTVLGEKDKTDADYEDLYFRDEFDNGLDDWWSLAGNPGVSKLYYSDNDDKVGQSFLADAFYNKSTEGCLIGKPFGADLNKIVEIDFFDHTNDGMENGYVGMSFQYMLNSFARADDGKVQRAIGVDHSVSADYYSYRVGSLTMVTNIKREYGWHTFKWDYTGDDVVKMYIDGKLIAEAPGESFSYIEMGDYGMGGFNAYDNVVVYGGEPAPDPIPLPEPPEPEEPDEEGKKLPGVLEAEEADSRPGTTQITNITGGKALGFLSVGDEIVFNVAVEKSFELPLTVRYASNKATAGFDLYIDDAKVASPVLGNPKGWDTYQLLTTEETLSVPVGEHTVKLVVTDNNFNLDYIAFQGEEPEESVPVESILPAVQGTLQLSVGNSVKIPYVVLPQKAQDQSVKWSTEDDGAVLTVSEDGTITAAGTGTATVTIASVSRPEVKASFEVEVLDAEASLISKTELGCVPSANVDASHVNYTPAKLIDGQINGFQTGWCAMDATKPGGRQDPSAYLTWETPQTVKEIHIYDIAEGNNYVEQMEIIFNDDPATKITLENGVPDGGMEKVTLEQPMENVTKIEFHILKASAPYNNYGFEEIKVFSAAPGEIPVNSVFFGASGVNLFAGGTYTLEPPVAVPSTATDTKMAVTLVSGDNIVSLRENTVDGRIRNYTITALQEGVAVVRATAANGVYADFTVMVGSKKSLETAIMEAELLYAKFPGESNVHAAFQEAIDNALAVYRVSQDMNEYAEAEAALREAMATFTEAMTPSETADEVAQGLALENPEKGATTLTKPKVPAGFEVTIDAVSPAGVVNSNWSIQAPDVETRVTVTLRVTRIMDGNTATKECTVTVPAYTAQEVLNTVTIPQPEKKDEALRLPKVPYGFALEIVSSTDDLIAEDGTVTWPLEDAEVTVKVRVTKRSNDTYAEKEFSFILPGIAKKLNTPIQADEIDAVKGTYIKVQNNEVVNFNGGDWIRYDNVNFGDTPKSIRFHINTAVHPNWAGKKIHVMLDDPTAGTRLGTVTVIAAGDDWGIYGMQEIDLTQPVSGLHTVYLVGEGGEGVGGVKEIMFEDITPELPETYTVTVENGTGDGQYAENAEVTITADAAPEGKVFDRWLSSDVELTDATAPSTTFVMPNHAVTVTATYRDRADTSALDKLIQEASKLTEGKYTAASWEKLENAKEAAQAVLENADATPQEVEEAYDALLDALVGLELIPVDKSNLKVAIDLAKPIVAEADRYVATTIEGLSELLAKAEALYADETATQEEIDEMAQRLLSASSQARLKANKTALKEAVEQAEGIDLSQYTEASAKMFSAALAKANGILADESLTEDDQALVDQAASALRTAIDGLVKAGAEDPDVSKPGESSQPGEPEEPSTGDSSPVLLIALFAGISALAALLLHKRRTQA